MDLYLYIPTHSNFIHKTPIMRDNNHCSPVILNSRSYNLNIQYIQIIRRFIQHKYVRRVITDHQTAQHETHPLSST